MSADTISVQCKCGKRLKAPATASGKKAKCPGCGNAVLIQPAGPATATAARPAAPKAAAPRPAAARPAAPAGRPPVAKPVKRPPPPPPPAEDSLDALYDLAADAEQAHVRGSVQTDDARCPQCQSVLPEGAVLCVNCGYNLKLGKSVATKVETAPKAAPPPPGVGFASKQKPVDAMAPTGSLLVGIGVSIALALGAGLIKFLITWKTEYDVFYLTVLIGAAAGLGMQIGYKGYSRLGGVMAAVVALVVIIITRVAIILAIFGSAMADDPTADYDDRVVSMMIEDNLKARGLDPDETTFEQDEAAEKDVVAQLKKMPKSEYEALIAKAEAKEQQDQLVEMLADEAMAGKTDTNNFLAEYEKQYKLAEKKVAAMTPEQRRAEKTRLEAKIAAAEAAEIAAMKDKPAKERGGPSAGAVAVGFVLVFFFVFGIWAFLATLVALAVAYKTAAGSVSG